MSKINHLLALSLVAGAAVAARGEIKFDAGADLRIRQELMKNVPGLPGGGVLSPAVRGKFKDHMRFRPRVWGGVRLESEDVGTFRIFARLTDEFRWNVEPRASATTFPDELILDNLYLEGLGLFDGRFDFRFGRQDIYGLYGLDHLFVDGTPGDGSRTVYADMVRMTWHVTDESALDVFAIYDFDMSDVRWGTERSRKRSLSGLGGGADPDMDDWGFGAVWSSNLGKDLPYKLFVMQKNTASFERGGVKHPRTQRELFGAKLTPRLTESLTLNLEAMAQVGKNGEGALLGGWSAYSALEWRGARVAELRGKPFGSLGFHFMSGDKDAASEDGGHRAWDPMWARGVNDSELMLYGTHYGAAWWSNMMFLKLSAGIEFARDFRLVGSTGPMFAAVNDGMGGGDGSFKGLLNQVRLDVPILAANREQGERFEILSHILAEFFNPGDYFETDKPSWFFRWQVDFRF